MDSASRELGLEDLEAVIREILQDANPRLALTASAYEGRLGFGTVESATADCFESWWYDGLHRLRAERSRMTAYALALQAVVARANVGDRLSDQIPHPALLVFPHLITAADFERERLNVELEEQAVAILRAREIEDESLS
jgi:hypothetical protein